MTRSKKYHRDNHIITIETLLRARAIETQTYVIAAAQVGQHNAKRASFGNAMVIFMIC